MKYYSGIIIIIISHITICASMLGGEPALGKVDTDDETNNIFEYPFFVVIRVKDINYKNPFICGGIILRPNWVLTQCVKLTLYPIHYYSVVAGNFSLPDYNRFTQIRKVVNIYCHINAKSASKTYTHDIALAQVQAPFQMTPFVSTVDIRPTTNPLSGKKIQCTFIGAGHNRTEDWDRKFYKHKTKVTVYTDVSECGISGKMNQYLLCSKGKGIRGNPGALCRGDGAGALYNEEGFVEGLATEIVTEEVTGEDECDYLMPRQNIVAYIRLDKYAIFDDIYPSDDFPTAGCKVISDSQAVVPNARLIWPLLGLGLWRMQA